MKTALCLLVIAVVASAQTVNRRPFFLTAPAVRPSPYRAQNNYDLGDGQYRPDNSGAYNAEDGKYHPDDSGAYRPDGAGAYQHLDDKYKHQEDKYKQQGDSFDPYRGGSDRGSGGSGGAGNSNSGDRFGSGGNGNNGNRFGSGENGNKGNRFGSGENGSNGNRFGSGENGNNGNRFGSAGNSNGNGNGFGVAVSAGQNLGLKQGNAAGLYDNRNYAIIRLVEQNEQDGYHYLYETENRIFGEEEGHLENKGQENEGMKAKGFFSYTGPDSVEYRVDYTADEEGFVPVAAHLPTPPPIPAAIVRSLEYQKSLGLLD